MNWTLVLTGALVAWCISASGCTLCQNAMRTVWHEPAVYSWKHDRRRSVESYRQWADAALGEEAGRCPDLFGEPDYVMGFRDGFVDFVYLGGTGEPPPVPPRQFWNVMLRSPDGKQRADLWFDGYRHGAAVARDGGYRELGRVHSSLAGFAGGPPYAAYPSPGDGIEAYGVREPLPDDEMLPEPSGDAPALTSPVESGDAYLEAPASEPQSPSTQRNTPADIEPPFTDDPERPAEATQDQPLSICAPVLEQQAEMLPPDIAEDTTAIEAVDAETFDVRPAVLLNAHQEYEVRCAAVVTKSSRASTVRFVDEPAKEESRATLVGESSADREVIGTSFRGWSRRVTTESTLNYRTPQELQN